MNSKIKLIPATKSHSQPNIKTEAKRTLFSVVSVDFAILSFLVLQLEFLVKTRAFCPENKVKLVAKWQKSREKNEYDNSITVFMDKLRFYEYQSGQLHPALASLLFKFITKQRLTK